MRSLIVAIALCAALLVAGCDGGKPAAPAVANAAPLPAPVPKPAAPAEAADTGLVVSGPIIVEHQLEITAQRDGVLAQIFFDAP